jgi:tripartite-type tricarboxylate transporter receptor subunit TctC
MKELPTLAESGLPNFEVTVWHGLYAPKGTPKPIVDTLASALQTALKDPNVKTRFADLGTEPVADKRATPEALRAHVKAEIERWSPIIAKAGVYAD